MAERIQLNGTMVYPECVIGYKGSYLNTPVVMTYYDRSMSAVKAFGANMSVCSDDFVWVTGRDEQRRPIGQMRLSVRGCRYDSFNQPIVAGKEKFFHGLSVEKTIGEGFLLIDRNRRGQMVYNWLMDKFDLPLLAEWGNTLADWLESEGYLKNSTFCLVARDCDMPMIPLQGELVPADQVDVYEVCLDQASLNDLVSRLLQKKWICIADEPMARLTHTDVDSYFESYGHSIVKNLREQVYPLVPVLDGEARDFTANSMRLYPQQIAQLNGDVALLEHGNYAIVNHGMGTGKTIVGAAACESFFVKKWLRSHPKCTLEDAYRKEGVINYRVVIMCPGHLVQKWHDEIAREIPFAKAVIVRDFSQLLELRERGRKPHGKEFYVMSKDFSKLSYQSKPSPKKRRLGSAMMKRCKDCGNEFSTPGSACPACGSRRYELHRTTHVAEGMVCPHCRQILLRYKFQDISYGGEGADALDFSDFTAANDGNSRCFYCDEPLWQPHVANIGTDPKAEKWYRATHYANKAHKGTKTVWVHRDYDRLYFERIKEKPLNALDPETHRGVRKYAPAEFIKRYLKGFFDIAIFDEAQDLKGGTTGQGHAMHCLIKASRKQLVMTGTIAGGYANHLFYTLFRLDPRRMVEKGFTFDSELAFSERYGNIEKRFEYSDMGSGDYNACCKGKQKSSPKVKPGISPMIFMDFLLDKTTFLDLSDMSRYLPPLREIVVSVPPETDTERDMLHHCREVVDKLKHASKEKENGFGLLSEMLQFSLSYPDKPYGAGAIKSPRTGAVICTPGSFTALSGMEWESLSAKEKRLVGIVSDELREGRGCVVYAEYTGKPETCVSYRLKEILERYCNLKGKVAVLESSSPAASKREEWMHRQAERGVKVFITNPRCVATGLDFCWIKDGVGYNYPTLIFYQLGYSLFVTWQASRRAFRLNQRKECKTIYMAWSGTAQEAAISLIAEKQAATAAIQGHFSAEGLAAMAQGVDARLKLAAALSDMDAINGNGLQDMFDVLGAENGDDDAMYQYKPMLLYKELMGEEAIVAETFEQAKKIGQMDLFAMIGQVNGAQMFVSKGDRIPEKEAPEIPVLEVIQSSVAVPVVLTMYRANGKSAKKKTVSGQLALF